MSHKHTNTLDSPIPPSATSFTPASLCLSRKGQNCATLETPKWISPLLKTQARIPWVPRPVVIKIFVHCFSWVSKTYEHIVTTTLGKSHYHEEPSLLLQRWVNCLNQACKLKRPFENSAVFLCSIRPPISSFVEVYLAIPLSWWHRQHDARQCLRSHPNAFIYFPILLFFLEIEDIKNSNKCFIFIPKY